MPKLIVIKGPDEEKEWLIPEGETSIGRQRDNMIVLSDPRSSRRHCSLQVVSGRCLLVNYSQTHGTYVNGVRIDDKIEIDDTDKIKVGETLFAYVLDETKTAADFRAADADSSQAEEGDGNFVLNDAAPKEGGDYEAILDPQAASLAALAGAAGSADQSEEAFRRLSLVQEIGQQLVTQLDLRSLFELILEKVFELLPVDTGSVLLFDPVQKRVVPMAVRNQSGSVPAEELKLSRSMVQFAVRNKVGVLSSDMQQDERFSEQQSVIMRGIRSAMCVPLIHSVETLGVIYIDNVITGYLFTESDLSLLTILANQAAVAVRNAKLCRQIVDEETMKANLARYLTPQLVDQIANNEIELGLGGRQVDAAILFSDIRGFTSLSESMAPEAVVTMLNAYFTEMTDIIFKYRGTLDKYVGDAVIAAFGSPVSDSEACLNALRCAVAMQECINEMSFKGPKFGVGIGLHFGEVIHGNVGSEKIMQYTVIGDTVNTSARFCGVAPAGKVLMSRAFRDKVGRELTLNELEPVKLKGKSEAMEIFEYAGGLDATETRF